MKRINDTFIEYVDGRLGLNDKRVLEIGCGNGSNSVHLANKCLSLIAIDPDAMAIASACTNYPANNLTYLIAKAEELPFRAEQFDTVIFSLSLHHVPVSWMQEAINQAVRVLTPLGRLVFLEPGCNGNFFDAEIQLGASDGDERREKAAAYFEILSSPVISEELEEYDEVTLTFDSDEDFIKAMNPKRIEDTSAFLTRCGYVLKAQRRINIFSLKL
jgi:ubiquinone/menaquinone biosynthesis C-methylase UbiE